MIASPEITCVDGDSHFTKWLRVFLHDLDQRGQSRYSYDEITVLHGWPDGLLQWFVELSLLQEIALSSQVYLWECQDPDWVEPEWLPDAMNGGRVMGFYLCSHDWCGMHVVDPERRRRWAPSMDGIIAALMQQLGFVDQNLVDVPNRVWRLGSMARGRESRDVFLVRGACWPDAATVLRDAQHLSTSANATLLCPNRVPPLDQRPSNWRTVLSLQEILAVRNGVMTLQTARLLEEQLISARVPCPVPQILTQEEVDVLEALAEQPDDPMLVAQLVAASGYGRDTVMKAIRRLTDSGLIARPGSSVRKGVVITETGRKRVGILPKMA